MRQARTPNLPTSSAEPTQQQLLSGLRELVGALLRSGVFIQRPSMDPVIVPRARKVSALAWESMNRVLTLDPAASAVQLPNISPRFIGAPLEVVLMDATNPLELVPSGRGASGVVPLINGASSLTLSAVGLYTLKTDGQNWFVG